MLGLHARSSASRGMTRWAAHRSASASNELAMPAGRAGASSYAPLSRAAGGSRVLAVDGKTLCGSRQQRRGRWWGGARHPSRPPIEDPRQREDAEQAACVPDAMLGAGAGGDCAAVAGAGVCNSPQPRAGHVGAAPYRAYRPFSPSLSPGRAARAGRLPGRPPRSPCLRSRTDSGRTASR